MMEYNEVTLEENRGTSSMLTEILMGLSQKQKSIHPKFLYDKRGSEIFERICQLEEYYPTRAEKEILMTYGEEMAELLGRDTLLVEPGSGSGEKVRFLMPHLRSLKGFVPIEISREILFRMTEELHEEYPWLSVYPVCADFTQEIELPISIQSKRCEKALFFPGSTIGNFQPQEAVDFLKKYAKLIGEGGRFIIGVDLKKETEVLERAYDDSDGVTAAFNLNLLERLNREAAATFDANNFFHRAFYNEEVGRVEMHLVSKVAQLVKVNQSVFRFQEGESIHTESSYKYSVEEFGELCAKAKLVLKKTWKDTNEMFCVYYLEKE